MSRVKNELGNKYGRLTVIGVGELSKSKQQYWKCLCSCGSNKITMVTGYNLRSGSVRFCGCLQREAGLNNYKDLTGQRFGKLLVLRKSQHRKPGASKNVHWVCRCDCGSEIVVNSHKLLAKNENIRSCHKCLQLPEGVAAFNNLFSHFCNTAKRRNLSQELSKDQFRELSVQPCYYCGKPPSSVSRSNGAIGTFIHNGLDRIDNEIRAYTIENTRPCCKTCNTAKLTLSLDDFRELVIKVYNTLVVQKRSPAVYITELLKIPDTELPKSPIRALVSEWKWLIIKQRKKPWSLTDAQAAWLSQQPCFYCGKKPSQLRKKCIYSGIDRIDSKKGYEIGNVVPCCKSCNIAKNTMTIGQFRDWVTAVYLHWLLPNINTVSNSKPEQPLVAPKTVLTNANLQATAE